MPPRAAAVLPAPAPSLARERAVPRAAPRLQSRGGGSAPRSRRDHAPIARRLAADSPSHARSRAGNAAGAAASHASRLYVKILVSNAAAGSIIGKVIAGSGEGRCAPWAPSLRPAALEPFCVSNIARHLKP